MHRGGSHGLRGRVGVAALLIALFALAPIASQAHTGHTHLPNRYTLANDCWAMNPVGGAYVAKSAGGYVANARRGKSERFYLKPTELGIYLVYDRNRGFLAAGDGNAVETATEPSPATEWTVRRAGKRLRLINLETERALTVGAGKRLEQAATGAKGSRFLFRLANNCTQYPEITLGASGSPYRAPTPYAEVRGTIDPHLHIGAYEFLGGGAHCGRPWHRYGVPYALVDCPDHGPGGTTSIFENVTYEESVGGHDTVGWPTFKDWPHPLSQTHEQTYYRWMERAWKAGTRIIVNDLVENEVLCRVYPFGKRNPQCDDMTSVRLQAKRMRELQNYIDAQNGGPGKGWFRIVRTPFQARRVINRGKLAVVLGVEVSRIFGCGFKNNIPQCDRADVDRGLDEMERMGVASLFPIHKFDNGFGGVRFDSGSFGVAINNANRLETGRYWDIETCPGPEHDNPQETGTPSEAGILGQGLFSLLTPGLLPIYPPPPHCNTRGLTSLGRYLIEEMIDRGIMIETDHMGVKTADAALRIAESRRYSGVLSTHTWSDPLMFRRIYRLGGFATPITEIAPDFIAEWKKMRQSRSRRFVFGIGFGADSNGLHSQPRARGSEGRVTYPFRSIDGRVKFRRQRSGQRLYDVNRDGVAHYGLHADWFQDLMNVAGRRIGRDLFRGAEAYLQTWERAIGVPGPRCLQAPRRFSHRGLGRMKIGMSAVRVLKRMGQPGRRVNRSYRWCVDVKRKDPGARAAAVFTRRGKLGLVASTARGHRIRSLGPNRPQGRAMRQFESLGGGLYVKRRGSALPTRVYGVRNGKIAFTGLAAPRVAASRASLARFLRLGGILR